MSELIANEDYEIKVTPQGAWTPADPHNPAKMTLVPILASKAKENNKKIIIKQISWTVLPSACTLASNTLSSGASAPPIQPDASKVKCDNQLVIREKDTGTCKGVFIHNTTSATTNCTCEFKINKAGQDKVKGE